MADGDDALWQSMFSGDFWLCRGDDGGCFIGIYLAKRFDWFVVFPDYNISPQPVLRSCLAGTGGAGRKRQGKAQTDSYREPVWALRSGSCGRMLGVSSSLGMGK